MNDSNERESLERMAKETERLKMVLELQALRAASGSIGAVGRKPESDPGRLPPTGSPVWVQCDGYRTIAYRDAEGKWRSVAKSEVLTGDVKVIEPL